MKIKSALHGKLTSDKLIFFVAVLVSMFWWLSQAVNVYHYKLVGIVFEILWLPAIAALFIIPLVTLILWAKQKFMLKSFHPLSIALIVITFLLLILKS